MWLQKVTCWRVEDSVLSFQEVKPSVVCIQSPFASQSLRLFLRGLQKRKLRAVTLGELREKAEASETSKKRWGDWLTIRHYSSLSITIHHHPQLSSTILPVSCWHPSVGLHPEHFTTRDMRFKKNAAVGAARWKQIWLSAGLVSVFLPSSPFFALPKLAVTWSKCSACSMAAFSIKRPGMSFWLNLDPKQLLLPLNSSDHKSQCVGWIRAANSGK